MALVSTMQDVPASVPMVTTYWTSLSDKSYVSGGLRHRNITVRRSFRKTTPKSDSCKCPVYRMVDPYSLLRLWEPAISRSFWWRQDWRTPIDPRRWGVIYLSVVSDVVAPEAGVFVRIPRRVSVRIPRGACNGFVGVDPPSSMYCQLQIFWGNYLGPFT